MIVLATSALVMFLVSADALREKVCTAVGARHPARWISNAHPPCGAWFGAAIVPPFGSNGVRTSSQSATSSCTWCRAPAHRVEVPDGLVAKRNTAQVWSSSITTSHRLRKNRSTGPPVDQQYVDQSGASCGERALQPVTFEGLLAVLR